MQTALLVASLRWRIKLTSVLKGAELFCTTCKHFLSNLLLPRFVLVVASFIRISIHVFSGVIRCIICVWCGELIVSMICGSFTLSPFVSSLLSDCAPLSPFPRFWLCSIAVQSNMFHADGGSLPSSLSFIQIAVNELVEALFH